MAAAPATAATSPATCHVIAQSVPAVLVDEPGNHSVMDILARVRIQLHLEPENLPAVVKNETVLFDKNTSAVSDLF